MKESSKLYFTIFLTFSFALISNKSFSRTNLRIIRSRVDSVLSSIVGRNNFERRIQFDEHHSMCTLIESTKFVGYSTFENEFIDFNPDKYDLIYNLDLAVENKFNKKIRVTIFKDANTVTMYFDGIPSCIRNDQKCNLISSDSAKQIVLMHGFPKGIRPWEIDLNYLKKDSEQLKSNKDLKIWLVVGEYYWHISSLLKSWVTDISINRARSYIGTGKVIDVNSINGSIIENLNLESIFTSSTFH